jgi:hypothetical protein
VFYIGLAYIFLVFFGVNELMAFKPRSGPCHMLDRGGDSHPQIVRLFVLQICHTLTSFAAIILLMLYYAVVSFRSVKDRNPLWRAVDGTFRVMHVIMTS